MTSLVNEVRELLDRARREATAPATTAALDIIAARLDEPLRVAFAGRVKAGKSTLLNALVGEELAPTDAGECTRIVTWYRDGHTYRVTLHGRDGTTHPAPFRRDGGALEIDLGGRHPADVDRIDVEWPSSRLAEVTLIDTPGLGSGTEGASAPTERFLSIDPDDAEAGPTEADAVIYLMRHLHQADLGFLESFHDVGLGAASPVNTIAVLSRADEVGACRPEAMQTARRIAVRYRSDPRLRRLCHTVLPVSGLVAQASMTLTEAEYKALRTLAEAPRAEADALLLTVDRFVAEGQGPAGVTPIERSGLLERFGLYGVRTAVRMIRLGAAGSATELAGQLREVSGIEELRLLLTTLFAERRDVLKARAALGALEALLPAIEAEAGPAADGGGGDLAARIWSDIERILASAHELTELQLLGAVRSGLVPLRPEEQEELERLIGQPGLSAAARLGVATGEERDALLAAIARWRVRGENPLSSRAVVETAQAVTRTLEGMLVGLEAVEPSPGPR